MRAVPFIAILTVLPGLGCSAPPAARPTELSQLSARWRQGTVEEADHPRVLAAIREMRAGPRGTLQSMARLTTLARLALESPSGLVRADALGAAWAQLEPTTGEPWRVDSVDVDVFNERASRLETLLDGERGSHEAELTELAHWLGRFRFPPERAAQAVTLADVVVSRALAGEGPLGEAFAGHAVACSRHALALVTLRAAGDRSVQVRQAAMRACDHLALEPAFQVLAGALGRESDSLVLLTALDVLARIAPGLPAEDVRDLLVPLRDATDVAIQSRVQRILEGLVG